MNTINKPEAVLLPCPFCGANAVEPVNIGGLMVTTCGDETDACQIGFRNFTINEWNTRTAVKPACDLMGDASTRKDEEGFDKPRATSPAKPACVDDKTLRQQIEVAVALGASKKVDTVDAVMRVISLYLTPTTMQPTDDMESV